MVSSSSSSFLSVFQLTMALVVTLVSLGHHDVVQAQTIADTNSITQDQLQFCKAAMIEVDVDLDGSINRAEYINLLSAVSPFLSACPGTGTISNFLSSTAPSAGPISAPSDGPSVGPSGQPSSTPSAGPTSSPTYGPSSSTSKGPSSSPSEGPTSSPSGAPTSGPSASPSSSPSEGPSSSPSGAPTSSPSASPSSSPSGAPSSGRSASPSSSPNAIPSSGPSSSPSASPSSLRGRRHLQVNDRASAAPSASPSANPSSSPSAIPSSKPSGSQSAAPSSSPSSSSPSLVPTSTPSGSPSTTPSSLPSLSPSAVPSASPSVIPSTTPSSSLSSSPSATPSLAPSHTPSASLSTGPSASLSVEPSSLASLGPFSTLFEDLACKCLEMEKFGADEFGFVDNADCCTEENQHLRVPGVNTPEGYTLEVCMIILETIDQECSTSELITSRSPSVSPFVLPSAIPSFKATVQIVESTSPPTPDFSLLQKLVAAAVGVLLLIIMILVVCIRRRLRAQHQQKIPKEVFVNAAKDDEEDSDHTRVTKNDEVLDHIHTDTTEGDGYDDDDRDTDYCFDLEHGFHDNDGGISSFLKQGTLLVGSCDEDDVETMQDEEQGIVNNATVEQGSTDHHDNPDYAFPTTSSLPSFILFSDDDYLALMDNPDNNVGDGSEASDNDDDNDDKIKNETVIPLTWKRGDDDDDDDMSTDDGSNGDTLTSLVSTAVGSSQGDNKDSVDDDDDDDRNKNHTVGPLTWQQGYDGDDDDMSTDDDSDGDTLTSLVSANDMSQADDRDSVAESFTSVDEKGSSLSSREIAINTIIEQSKNGAEWFEFNLPSDDGDDDNVSDDDHDDLFMIDNLGFDPADVAALRAIANRRSYLSLR